MIIYWNTRAQARKFAQGNSKGINPVTRKVASVKTEKGWAVTLTKKG